MLSPIELIDIAEAFTSRIPSTPEYDEERNIAWLAVGTASLELNDIVKAGAALNRLDSARAEATLRVEGALWTKTHPDSQAGRDLLQETVSRIPLLEEHLSRKDITDMVPAILRVLGLNSIHSMATHLVDPFSASNVYVEASLHTSDTRSKRAQLSVAETFATQTREGDRDFALRWVFRGYQHAGLLEDAQRIRELAKMDPEWLTERENVLFGQANEALMKFESLAPKAPADTQAARLRRFLDYRMNDLKVIFLTDACRAGGISEPEIEEMIRGESFMVPEPPRPWHLNHDTSKLDEEAMARFLFDRPICQNDADQHLLYGENTNDLNPEVFILQITRLLRNFARLIQPYSMAQVDQGLWFVLGHPFWLRDVMDEKQIQLVLREECFESMIHPFRDYLSTLDDRFDGTIFFMWWDMLLDHGDEQNRAEMEPVVLNVLGDILRLPNKACQFAALHGLNHLHPSSKAVDEIQQYLGEYRESLTAEEIGWVQRCAAGSAP